MEPATRQRIDRLQRRKNEFLATLSPWTPEQRAFQAAPGSWCANEVLDHVVKTESEIFAELQRCLPLRVRPPFSNAVRSAVVIAVMSSPVRVSVPKSATAVLPSSSCDPAALLTSWHQLRQQMLAWASSLPTNSNTFGAFRHPVCGWMSLSQAFTFLGAHIRHHGYQLARIRRAQGWPA